jgi:hypothetical protein
MRAASRLTAVTACLHVIVWGNDEWLPVRYHGSTDHQEAGGNMKAPLAVGIAALIVVAGCAAVLGFRAQAMRSAPGNGTGDPAPAWSETRWPFLLDQWGVGRAFTCQPADCGVRIEVFIRPKIGFCNCATGVSDDAELERVADTDLVSPTVQPLGPGQPVKVGWMYGLSRTYQVSDNKPRERLLSVAFNDGCDVVVALAALGTADQASAAPAVFAFLNSTPVLLWAKKELGLEFVHRDW